MGYALSGKTALVTGANRGLGEAIVDALVAAGVRKVYAAARRTSALGPLVLAQTHTRTGSYASIFYVLTVVVLVLALLAWLVRVPKLRVE